MVLGENGNRAPDDGNWEEARVVSTNSDHVLGIPHNNTNFQMLSSSSSVIVSYKQDIMRLKLQKALSNPLEHSSSTCSS